MGKQKDLQVEGTFDDVIFYKSRGRYLVRSKGKTGTQAPIARIQAGRLGKASAISARIRAAVNSILPDPKNRALMYSLNNALQGWLRSDPSASGDQLNNIPFLNGFPFAGEEELVKMFASAMPVFRNQEGSLTLHIPALDSPNPIAPLPFNGQIDFRIIGIECDINNTVNTKKYETNVHIDYDGTPIPGNQLTIPLQLGLGKLAVVVVSVNNHITGIVGAFYN